MLTSFIRSENFEIDISMERSIRERFDLFRVEVIVNHIRCAVSPSIVSEFTCARL